MAKRKNALIRFVLSPGFLLLTGVVLAGTSGVEVFDELEELMSGDANLGSHHGVFFLGIIHLLHGISEMMEGSAVVGESAE